MPRDSGGSETLPQPPAVDGTVASAAWINAQLGDLAAEVTDSLSRSGKGGLLSPLKFLDGSVSLPAITFTSEPASGWYRVAANILALVIAGAEKLRATLTGVAVTGALGVTGSVAATGDVIVDAASANSGTLGSNALRFAGVAGGEGIGNKRTVGGNQFGLDFRTVGGNQFGLDFYTNSVVRMSITNGGAVTGLPTPAGASDAATKGYVDARFVVAGRVTGGTSTVASQTGSVTATVAKFNPGFYDVSVPGLTTGAIITVCAYTGADYVASVYTVSSGVFRVALTAGSTAAPVDPDFSFVVFKL